ncbi:MAG: hypothetical protein J6Z41_08735 [Prevotella sp.]|jgi:hypothetical protein|nr:hypothetical protein [Prevotella sp.]
MLKYIGLVLLYCGVLLLAIGYMVGWTNNNLFLTGVFVAILIGAILHLKKNK